MEERQIAKRTALPLWKTHMLVASLLLACSAQAELDFARDVLPILSDSCFHCHGPDAEAREAGLRLDVEEDAKRNYDGTFMIKPGDLEASEVIHRIVTTDPDEVMPPPRLGRPLKPEQVETLKQWVKEGAKWGKHWAFEPVLDPDPGSTEAHPVDAFVERRLAKTKDAPTLTPRADKPTLIRRLHLDLTGLPPTPEAIEQFLADDKPGAWERLVDRVLASPAYGERMAWDWLDAARYADTNGYQGDRERTMWPWRDWVIKAFNDNMPYDEFTVQQLAGDLLPDATDEQILATAFNRNYMINGEGGRIAEENRVDYVFDMTETMGTIWLGLTLNCARCHDHKYDPLTQAEYYQLTGFFNQTPVTGGGGDPFTKPVMSTPSESQTTQIAEAESKRASLQEEVNARAAALRGEQADWETKQREMFSGKKAMWSLLPPAKVSAEHQKISVMDKYRVVTSGPNPKNDAYEIDLPLPVGPLTAIRLEGLLHSTMTKGRLARSDSGNFVLTDISFDLLAGEKETSLKITGAEASFEQGSYTIAKTFDNDKGSGWAVLDRGNIKENQSAVFQLENTEIKADTTLRVRMRFDSRHPHHNLGHFRLSATGWDKPSLKAQEDDVYLTSLKTPAAERSEAQKKAVRVRHMDTDPKVKSLRAEREKLRKKIENIRKSIPRVMVMADMEKPRPTYILDRGIYTERRDEVPSQTPAILPPLTPEGEHANRLDLAKWLVDPDHPLTARVTVNRFWQMLFGIGLVKTAEDFGVQAEYPPQRELLDWLSREFVRSGWDVKGLLKTIVTSETYCRSAAVEDESAIERDPANRFHARGPRFRMPSWMIRDQALAASGILNPKIGGPSVYSYQPQGIWSEVTFGKKKYREAKGDDLYRRSLYTYWRRIVGPTMFFDNAKRQVCEVKPIRTNTPMQALNTLNGVTYVEAARHFAETLLAEGKQDDKTRMEALGQRLFAHAPSDPEREVWQRSLERARKVFTEDLDAAKAFVSHGDSKPDAAFTKDETVAELAAWSALCLNLLNLDEVLNKP